MVVLLDDKVEFFYYFSLCSNRIGGIKDDGRDFFHVILRMSSDDFVHGVVYSKCVNLAIRAAIKKLFAFFAPKHDSLSYGQGVFVRWIAKGCLGLDDVPLKDFSAMFILISGASGSMVAHCPKDSPSFNRFPFVRHPDGESAGVS